MRSSPSLLLAPPDADRDELAERAQGCQACELYKRATRAVFGEGPVPARLMLVGETPGDHEDLEGHPFVGPAGRLLDEALEEAGIARSEVYLTNAVKHFKWEPRGKRRLHVKPSAAEVHACNGWLQAEVRIVKPRTIACLGATAAQVMMGRSFRITKSRGVVFEGTEWARRLVATYHPSALLRMRALDPKKAAQAWDDFVRDLVTARGVRKVA